MDILKAIPVITLLLPLFAMTLLAPAPVLAAYETSISAATHEVKAAFIYNFTKFVLWPSTAFENDYSPFRACVVDDRMLDEALESLVQSVTKGRQIQTIRYRGILGADKCHLLFIGESTDPAQAKKILGAVASKPVLTIGDSSAFIKQGGIIRFITSDNRLIFEINPVAAKRNGLEISSKLLGLSKTARDLP